MKKSPFFIRLFSSYLLIILILSIVIYISSFKIIKNYYIDSLTESLNNICYSLEPNIKQSIINNNIEEIDYSVKQIGSKTKIRITIIATNGQVLGDSEKNPYEMENHKYRIEVQSALKWKKGKSLRFSKTVKQEMLYVAVPIIEQNRIIGIIRSSVFSKDITKLLKEIKIRLLKIVLLIIIFALVLSIFFSNKITKPVKKLVAAAQKITTGDFNVKIFLKKNDEFKKLADTFNVMTEKISDLFSELTSERNELISIISSIKEGLFVINKEGKIILYNTSIQKITNNNNIKNRFYWEIFTNNKLLNIIRNTIEKKSSSIKEIKLSDKYYLCSSAIINKKDEIIFVLYDITDIKKIETIKKDFVTNVSHELKTPLTAIKGFSETLLDAESDSDKLHYISIIQRHTERMINIVNDLILLSELENRLGKIELSNIDVINILNDVVLLFKETVHKKKLKLKFKHSKEQIFISGDRFKLEQLFINLIDNAIKYTDKGTIDIKISENNKKIIIIISDTGIGIPEEDLDRIFERFYVVNKARSRKTGGTGLGLSIVKHIINLHNGTIDISSRLNKGTTITITFPGI